MAGADCLTPAPPMVSSAAVQTLMSESRRAGRHHRRSYLLLSPLWFVPGNTQAARLYWLAPIPNEDLA